MLLGELLHDGVIKTGLEAKNKVDAIEELIDLLVEAHEIPISQRDPVVEAVMARERSMSTGMEKGIALPHGASDRIDDIIAALGVVPAGIPFESLDGRPAKLIVLLILPKDKYQSHVRTLAGIAHLLKNENLREMLINAESPEEILRHIEMEEEKELFDTYR